MRIRPTLLILVSILVILSSCDNNVRKCEERTAQITESEFTYDNNGHIEIPVLIRDTIASNLLFDTGNGSGLILKRSFALQHNIKSEGESNDAFSGFGLNVSYGITSICDSISLSYGGTSVTFPSYSIVDDNSQLSFIIGRADGIIPIGQISSMQINFSKSTIALNQECNLHDVDSLLFTMESSGLLTLHQVPLILGENRDSILKHDFIIDTGYRGDIFLNCVTRDDFLLGVIENTCSNRYLRESIIPNVSKELYYVKSHDFVNRDIWIECDVLNSNWRHSSQNELYLLGVEYIKTFDWYFNFTDNSVCIKPIEYKSIVDEDSYLSNNNALRMAGRFKKNTLIAMYISSSSIYAKLGVAPGDEIVTINNRSYLEMRDSVNNCLLSGVITIDVIRDGECISLSGKI